MGETTRFQLRGTAAPVPFQLTDEQQSVVGNRLPRLRVLAGPGTGKTATLVSAVADRVLNRGVDPTQILVLTFSRRASAELSSRLVNQLGQVTREPMVRTLHSYAYSLLRAQAVRKGEPAPRLLGAAESDVMIRELLAGHHEDGGRTWPQFLHQALILPSFAAEVRDLLARCIERNITPGRMRQLAKRLGRPEWEALADFAREYPDVVDLRTGAGRLGPALDQAELMGAALSQLRDDETLAREQRRTRRIFVDEYQDVDPAQAKLIELLATGADELVVVGDPDQSIYAFRGSDPMAMRDIEVDRTVSLTAGRRMSPIVAAATRRVAALLPGGNDHRDLQQPTAADEGRLEVRVFPASAAEAGYLADRLRRAHLQRGLGWNQMAVLVRSPTASLPTLRRAFATAGIPLTTRTDDAQDVEPTVEALLLLLRSALDPTRLTGSVALQLMSSPLAGVDGVSLRRLRRALKAARPDQGSSADLLAAVLLGAPVPQRLPEDLRRPLAHLVGLIEIAVRAGANADAESVLWDLWQRSELEGEFVAQALRGGRAGQRADAALDGVVGMFAAAADHADLLPGAGIGAFVEYFTDRTPMGDGAAGSRSDAVQLLSAHAAKGLEWDLVAVAGVTEGSWPNLRQRGNLLGVDELLDAAAGVPPATVDTAARLADERRLFYVATTRARSDLLVTAVQNTDARPSRFLYELAGVSELETGAPARGDGLDHRGLNAAELIADLRRAVCDPESDPATAAQAAEQLAVLARAGIRAADPANWWGIAEPSTDASPLQDSRTVKVSPSLVESLHRCGLRAVLERTGGRSDTGQARLDGILVHALAHGLAIGVAEEELRRELDSYFERQTDLPLWLRERSRRMATKMLGAAQQWIAGLPEGHELLGSEVPVDVVLPADPDGPADQPEIRLAGRADWVSKDENGRAVVVDFKTGATKVSKADAAEHAQLASYQVAASLGGFEGTSTEPGGADLVYLRSGTPAVLHQDGLKPQEREVWLGQIRKAADRLSSAALTASENKFCPSCPVRSSCPLRDEGRQVTR